MYKSILSILIFSLLIHAIIIGVADHGVFAKMTQILSLLEHGPHWIWFQPGCEGTIDYPIPVPPMGQAHWHYELEMNLVVSGSATYLLNDRKYHLRRNTMVWLFPGQEHILLDISPDYEMWLLIWSPALVDRICTTPECRALTESDPAGFYSKQLNEGQLTNLSEHFQRVCGFGDDRALYNAALGYTLLLAWHAFQNADDDAAGSALHPAVEVALRIMRRDSLGMPIPEIARAAGLTQSRLSKLFRSQTGMGLIEFRNVVRIEQFQRNYGTGQRITMLQAALDAGFGSYPQFHRTFRDVIGVSPQEHYRQRALLAEAAKQLHTREE